MANNLGIIEVSLGQAANSLHPVNGLDPTGLVAGTPRKTWDQTVTIRILGHVDDSAAEEDDPDLMALFVSKYHGHPWTKQLNVLERVLHTAGVDPLVPPTPTNVSVLFPNFDYSTF